MSGREKSIGRERYYLHEARERLEWEKAQLNEEKRRLKIGWQQKKRRELCGKSMSSNRKREDEQENEYEKWQLSMEKRKIDEDYEQVL